MTDQNTAPLDPSEAIEFMDSAAVMLGRGEMPAPGTEYAAKWYLAHEALISQAREAERMRGALQQARNQVVAFAIDTIGADQAVKAVAYIDQALAPATGGGE